MGHSDYTQRLFLVQQRVTSIDHREDLVYDVLKCVPGRLFGDAPGTLKRHAIRVTMGSVENRCEKATMNRSTPNLGSETRSAVGKIAVDFIDDWW